MEQPGFAGSRHRPARNSPNWRTPSLIGSAAFWSGKAYWVVVMAGLLERSWMLLGTERGFIEGSCDFDLGLPAWLALDQWFPEVFKVWEACGYTTELLFEVSMAEGLVAMSSVMVLGTIVLTITAALGSNAN